MVSKVFFYVLLIAFFSCSTEKKGSSGGSSAEANDIPSPRREAKGSIDGVNIFVDYGSPGVKGRKIWGGLEKFGKVWRAGANETTSISFDKNVLINNQPLDSGKYALFIIPNKDDDWVVVINRDWDEWGAFSYDQAQDVLRLKVTPDWQNTVQERLKYSVDEDNLVFAWEKAKLKMEVKAMDSE